MDKYTSTPRHRVVFTYMYGKFSVTSDNSLPMGCWHARCLALAAEPTQFSVNPVAFSHVTFRDLI